MIDYIVFIDFPSFITAIMQNAFKINIKMSTKLLIFLIRMSDLQKDISMFSNLIITQKRKSSFIPCGSIYHYYFYCRYCRLYRVFAFIASIIIKSFHHKSFFEKLLKVLHRKNTCVRFMVVSQASNPPSLSTLKCIM